MEMNETEVHSSVSTRNEGKVVWNDGDRGNSDRLFPETVTAMRESEDSNDRINEWEV